MSIQIDYTDMYGVEIIGNDAFTERIITETAFGKQRGNDFEGTKEECIKFIADSGATEIYGALK